jgi:3-dehydroshikimate dehydratase
LKASGARFLTFSDNYYLDLSARFALDDEFVALLRAAGILYDRDESGEFMHVFTDSFEGRFFFEVCQRIGAYDGHGESNAPIRIGAQVRRAGAGRREPAGARGRQG